MVPSLLAQDADNQEIYILGTGFGKISNLQASCSFLNASGDAQATIGKGTRDIQQQKTILSIKRVIGE